MLEIFFLVLNLCFALLILFLTVAFLTGAPFVPTVSATSEQMLSFSDIKKGTKVYDLGSGDGRLLFAAAKRGAVAVGYEINPYLVFYTNLRAFFSPYRNCVHAYWRNFWTANINDADVVYIYLLPWRMEALEKKLRSELRPGAKVVSNSFVFTHWKPKTSDTKTHAYLYINS